MTNEEQPNLPSQWGRNFRKALIIVLAAILLIALTFVTIRIKELKDAGYQEPLTLTDFFQTRQALEPEPPQQRGGQVVVSDTASLGNTIDTTDLVPGDSVASRPLDDDAPIIPIYELEKEPTAVKKVEPKYPELARKGQVEGAVMVEIVIGLDGKVESAVVIEAKPKGYFDDAALEAARQWEFTPAMQRDKPVKVRMSLPFIFKLQK